MKIPVLSTGLSGLVGSRVKELLQAEFEFQDLSLETGINLLNENDVKCAFEASAASVVLHMAAKTDVDSCEDDKTLGEEGQAWLVNVVASENIVNLAKKLGKRLIYISTDFVFDGAKDFYSEDDKPNPISWYAVTKYEAEQIVASSGVNSTIVRIAYPYKAVCLGKQDFVHRILEKIKQGQILQAVTDHLFTPTFIDDIAVALSVFLKKDITGIYHLVGSQHLTISEAISLIGHVFQLSPNVQETTRAEYFRGRAFRPFKLALKNAKIKELGIKPRRFDKGLSEVKSQLQQ